MKKWLFFAFLSVLCACEASQEDVFLINYSQQFTLQLAKMQEETIQEAIFQTKINPWLKPKNAEIDSFLKLYQNAANQLIISVKMRQNPVIIKQKISFFLSIWEKIDNRFFFDVNNKYEVESRTKKYNFFNDKIANFYQILSFVERVPNDCTWNVLDMAASQLVWHFSAYIEGEVHYILGMYDEYAIWEIYTEQPIKINQETPLHFAFIPPQPNRCQIIVNQQLISEKYKTEYEFIPKEKGLQEVEIAAQVYELNGDTVFLSKKIQLIVEK